MLKKIIMLLLCHQQYTEVIKMVLNSPYYNLKYTRNEFYDNNSKSLKCISTINTDVNLLKLYIFHVITRFEGLRSYSRYISTGYIRRNLKYCIIKAYPFSMISKNDRWNKYSRKRQIYRKYFHYR